jgi:hypothetical protein
MKLKEYLGDLLGSHYTIDEAVIVGPYITEDFIDLLRGHDGAGAKTLPRSRLTVVADDGWDQQQLDAIEKLYDRTGRSRREVVIHRAAPLQGHGLVHAKLYFFTLKNAAGSYTKKILLLGSANASVQGFGGHAESFINIDLADVFEDHRAELGQYLAALRDGQDPHPCGFSIGRGTWVRLPAIRFVGPNLISGFDAWLRNGRLCHKYEPDAAFGRLPLRLKQSLPARELEGAFGRQGFGSERETKALFRSYARIDDFTQSNDPKPVWRGRYFIETFYGHWASGDCYQALKEQFKVSRAERRQQMLKGIQNASADDHEQWLHEFGRAVVEVGRRLAEAPEGSTDVRLADLFEMRNGVIDLEPYREAARKKLQLDQALAQDGGFAERYASGFFFPRVPQMGEEHEQFALDWCASVVAKMGRLRLPNRIASVVSDLVGEDADMDADALLGWLRENWRVAENELLKYHHEC